MVKWESKKLEDILKLLIGLTIIVLVNMLGSQHFHRFDLTEEKRFSIKEPTKKLLKDLDDVVYIEVYLDGELNAGFKRLQRSINEILEEFRVYGGGNIQYTFVDPSSALSNESRNEFMQAIMDKGIQPTNIIDERDGNRTEKLVFPGAIVSYGGIETGVMLLKGNQAATAEEKLNQSIEGIEYHLASTIRQLTTLEQKSIAIIRGHDELGDLEMASLLTELSKTYNIQMLGLDEISDNNAAVIIAKPKLAFTEYEKYYLDQYIMNGGNVLFFLDKLHANMDSATNEHNYAFPYDLNIDDQLFRYGVRVNNDLIQDNSSGVYPVVMGNMGDQPQVRTVRWPFFPLINRYSDHVITRNLDAIIGRFTSTIDTVKADGVKKTPLMFTSQYSRSVNAPVKVSIQDLRKNLKPELLNEPYLPVAYLLEGRFTSLYKNRFLPEGMTKEGFKENSNPDSRILVVADGDIAKNDINPNNGNPQALGFDPFMNTTFANQEFILNALAYMLEDDGLITAKSKEIKIRPLDKVKIANERLKWQLINLVLPIILLIVFGIVRYYLRKKKYTGFETD